MRCVQPAGTMASRLVVESNHRITSRSMASTQPALEILEMYVIAPKGYRPHDWVERLMNWDECAELDADLVYPKFVEGRELLVVRAELLDEEHSDRASRMNVFIQVLNFVKENGHTLTIDSRLETNVPSMHRVLLRELEQRSLKLERRNTKT